MRSVQYVGIPDRPADAHIDAGIVALKSRSVPVKDAIRLSLEALDWLKAQGCQQYLFKYCSTFDSTAEGNIGPVAEALADALDARQVLVCPAFPATGRSVYQGHLFVSDQLLNESGMEHHPLTPMTDPDIRRWLDHQVRNTVGHVPATIVAQGTDAVRSEMQAADTKGHRLIVADAIHDSDLVTLGQAARGLPLLTGGSGIAVGLPDVFRRDGMLTEQSSAWEGPCGKRAILSGSCSTATRAQVALHAKSHPTREVAADDIISGAATTAGLAEWALSQEGSPLIYTSADPKDVRAAQDRHGRATSAEAIEGFFAETARQLIAGGVTTLVTAGGETSGAVVEGLSLTQQEIGPEIDPGVPIMRAGPDLVLALKSGNFGAPDFFTKAFEVMESGI